MGLPMGVLAVGVAVVDLPARAAHHFARAQHESEALGTHALPAVAGAGVEEGLEWRRAGVGVIRHKHVSKHAPHEAAKVDRDDHGTEAEIPPELAKHQPEIRKMGVHHAAKELTRVARKIVVGMGVELRLHDRTQPLVQPTPHRIRDRIPCSAIKRLELRRRMQVAPNDKESDVDLDVPGSVFDPRNRNDHTVGIFGITHKVVCFHRLDVSGGRVFKQVAPFRALLDNLQKWFVRIHIERLARQQQPTKHSLLRINPMTDKHLMQWNKLIEQMHRKGDPNHLARPERIK